MDMKKKAEVVVLGTMFAVSMSAPLSAIAAPTALAATTSSRAETIGTGAYVLEQFTLNLSANVALTYDADSPTAVAVTSASTKGMHTFGGTSNGGSVKQCETTSVSAPSPGTPDLDTGCP